MMVYEEVVDCIKETVPMDTTMVRYAPRSRILDYKASSVSFLLAMALCCVVAWLLHVGIERPLLNVGKR